MYYNFDSWSLATSGRVTSSDCQLAQAQQFIDLRPSFIIPCTWVFMLVINKGNQKNETCVRCVHTPFPNASMVCIGIHLFVDFCTAKLARSQNRAHAN